MLPLKENSLGHESEWHAFKDVLVICRYQNSNDAESLINSLADHLKCHEYGLALREYIASHNSEILDEIARRLTQRELPEAWLILERL